MIRKCLFILFLVYLCSCSSDSSQTGYWLTPENQKGDISGFYADSIYCSELNKLLEIKKLKPKVYRDSIDVLYKEAKEICSETLRLSLKNCLNDLEDFYLFMTAESGGFCKDLTNEIPILPFRKMDVEEFLRKEIVERKFKSILFSFNETTRSETSYDVDYHQIDALDLYVNLIEKDDLISSMIFIRKIQIDLLLISIDMDNKMSCP